jgi:glycosyltransferase involved in cell wall biosynthesis
LRVPEFPRSNARVPRHILYIITEDWFFRSHFLPMARAARDAGYRVSIMCRTKNDKQALEQEGFSIHPMQAERGSFNPFAALGTLFAMRRTIATLKPDVVHLIALRSILLGGPAARLAGARNRVIAVTGLGFLGASGSIKAHAARTIIRCFLAIVLRTPGDRYLFENASDAALLGLDGTDTKRITIVGGAGVNPVIFASMPLPPAPPLKVALVARMLWSKGIDLAVEAVTAARERGIDVTLDLYGAPDPSNPKAVPEATLRDWSTRAGIRWHGAIAQDAAPGVWASHHLAILPSRGGEGLPRTLLEAASCGRAMLTTDVPGCRDFVEDGVTGRVVPAADASALADALVALAADPARLGDMGAAARAKVLESHTEAVIGSAIVTLYDDMLADECQTSA